MNVPQIYTRPTAYDVSMFPDGEECSEQHHWDIRVEYRGRGLWAVLWGGRQCLGTDGAWDWEPSNSSRTDAWLAAHRFPLEDALTLAREQAPLVTVNGHTALDALALHRERHTHHHPCY